MTTPETKVKKAVVKILDKHGAYHFFPATHGYGRSGVPDIVACHNGRFIGIECKAGKGVPTALQERELRLIQQAGGISMVIREDTTDLLDHTLSTPTSSQERTNV
jgi:Holliday junction resolvase